MSRTLLLAILFSTALAAQTVPPESAPVTERPVQAPLRSAPVGTVVTVQNPLPAGLQSVNTITSTVQVQGAYQGSVPSAPAPGPPVALTLDEAVRRGLQYNLGTIINSNALRQAQGGQWIARSALLPYVAGDLLVTEQQTNLAALGFSGFPGIPTIVGPFHYFDLRTGVSQQVLNLTSLNNYRASGQLVQATRYSADDARDLIVLAVTGGYVQILAAEARVTTTRAQVATAQATYQQAVDRLTAGVVPRIDVTRTHVQLQTMQTRLIAMENDLAKLRLSFARLIGLHPAQDYSLTTNLEYAPLTNLNLIQALDRAFAYRSDLKAANTLVRAAELAKQAAMALRYPTVQVSADYGVIGPSPTNSHGTFGITGAVRVPVFQGGRVRGEVEQADAALAQRRADLEDLRGRVEAEVRAAFLDLTAAANQVAVAQSNRALAQEALTQARDRFSAGVTNTLEVIQAEEAVAAAEQDYISALYAHNLAKATLARAMGQADQNIRQFLLGRP